MDSGAQGGTPVRRTDQAAQTPPDTRVPDPTPAAPGISGPCSGLQLSPGVRPLPDYELIALLGRGGFGEVWKALGPGDFEVGLKFIPLGDQGASTELNALKMMKGIRHGNLLPVFGAWQKGGLLIIAMELADGTLWHRWREAITEGHPGIPRDELLEYMREAARGLDFLNERRHVSLSGERVGIQHKDVKPQNALLVGGTVKIADFGLAKVLENSVAAVSGGLTPAYAAPEFFSGQATRWSDQYSLAVTYCQLRGGRLPIDGNPAQIVAGHVLHEPDLTMLPEQERPAVRRALAKKPQERWPTCQEFVRAVASAVPARAPAKTVKPKAAPTAPSAKVKSPPAPPRRRRRVLTAGIVLLVLALLAPAAWWAAARLMPVTPTLGLESPGEVAVQPGLERDVTLPLRRQACAGPVEVRLEGLPRGVAVHPVGVAGGANTARLELTVSKGATPATQDVRAIAVAADLRAECTFRLTIRPRPAAEWLAEFDEAIHRQPTDPANYCNRGWAYLHLEPKNPDRALADLDRAVELDPAYARACFLRGEAHAAKEEYDKAEADYGRVVQLESDNVGAWYERGLARFYGGKFGDAIADLSKAIDLDPKSAKAYSARGAAYAANRDPQKAVENYKKAIELDPKSASAEENWGLFCAGNKDYEEAIRHFSRAVSLEPTTARLYNELGNALAANKDYREAVKKYTLAINFDPKNALYYDNMGQAYALDGQYGLAIAAWNEAVARRPGDAHLYNYLGHAYAENSDYAKAVSEYTLAIRHDPKFATAYRNRADAYERQGESAKAQADRDKAAALDAGASR